MATVTTNQMNRQPATGGLAGTPKFAFGVYTISTALSANDLIQICTLPKNAIVVDGFLRTDDIDTGTETLELDVGWAANGGASTATMTTSDGTTWTNAGNALSANGFIDSGVLTGDVITDVQKASMNSRRFELATGPKYFSEDTIVQVKVTAAANATGTGTVYVGVWYFV